MELVTVVKNTCCGACGLTKWEDESNESVYERSGMGPCVNRVWCSEVDEKRWFDHIERKKE